MLDNQITLAVDEDNDGVGLVNVVFTRFEEFQNRAVYIAANHALNARDLLTVFRSFPKPNGNFRGVAKSTVKFTMDVTVLGVDGVSTLTSPMIGEVSFSLPVGVTAAQTKKLRQRVISLLDLDTVMGPLNDQLMI